MSHGFKVYNGAYPHFITSTVTHWIPVFCRADYFNVLADSLRFCAKEKGLRIHGYVLMPNHFHAICSQVEGRLVDVVRDLKGYTSRQIKEMLESDHRDIWLRAMERAGGTRSDFKLWQDAFHPEEVHSRAFFTQKLDYMHNNPLRAGYVDDPSEWKFSSAGFYYKDRESPVPITPPEW